MTASIRTHTWRKLRQQWQHVINSTNGIPCWRNCGTTIHPGDKWHLGHKIDRAKGGTNNPANLAPECEPCNLHHGGKTGMQQRNRKLPSRSL